MESEPRDAWPLFVPAKERVSKHVVSAGAKAIAGLTEQVVVRARHDEESIQW